MATYSGAIVATAVDGDSAAMVFRADLGGLYSVEAPLAGSAEAAAPPIPNRCASS